ncbi:MAG: hypothetical protein ABIH46_02365 [Chloroflexota bacterium]
MSDPFQPFDPLGLFRKRVLPDPLGIFKPSEPEEAQQEHYTIDTEGCQYGLECVRDHLLRAHLYISEALRFSSQGAITPEAVAKVRLARTELLCQDDFQQALEIEAPLKYEVLKLLASTRETWKAIERAHLDQGEGTPDDLREVAKAIRVLYEKAYEIDKQYRGR